MKRIPFVFTLALIVLLASCNLPGGQATPSSPDAAFTQAAETVAAELTRVALLASPTPDLPTETFTPSPSNTPPSTPTFTAVPCNLAAFVSDVTVPDNTQMNPGQTFEKIWRLRNVGSCTWTSSYKVTFEKNNGLGVPAGYSQPLTAGVVPPGQTVDISVNLTAPVANGTYRGDWALRDPGNVLISTFIVIIKVNATPTTTTLAPVAGEGGAVRADGGVFLNDYVIGDSAGNSGLQAFISYDISGIPAAAFITEVKVDLAGSGQSSLGNAFTFGCLRLYPDDYGALDAGDYYLGALGSPYVEWCSAASLTNVVVDGDLKTLIQSRLGNTRIKVRLQFPTANNANGAADSVRFTSPRLIVSYTAP